MLAVPIPKDMKPAALLFLDGWSRCMHAMAFMTETDKRQIEKLFKEALEPRAHCPEMRALNAALITYLLHKCASLEGVGSAIPRGEA